MIYSDVFPQIEGDVYFYQEISDTAVDLLGTGFSSSFVSGAAQFEPPNVIVNFIPMQYQDQWTTKSKFSISKDTTILGLSGEFKLAVDDSAWSLIDAWGTITLPFGEFECLRMKSYVTMNEQVTFNGVPVTQKIARVINYNWIAKDYGLVMRVASHTAEQDDNFTDARLYSRMTRFTSIPTSVQRTNNARPSDFSLMQNFPNPFNPSTKISFQLLKSDIVTLSIFNAIGQEVKTLVANEHLAQGNHTYTWDGTHNTGNMMPSGAYLYKLNTATSTLTRKMNLVH
jgi:hypothetical protein